MPFGLVGYAATARLPLWRYFWTTMSAYMPVTALSVYFGTRLEGIKATDPLAIGHFIVRRYVAAAKKKRPA